MTAQQGRKQHIRAFMRSAYTDERLAQLLAHAQDGKLEYSSCCCFVGIPTANHSLQSAYRCITNPSGHDDHLTDAHRLRGAWEAEEAFLYISPVTGDKPRHDARIRILIPMIRAEQRRRERALAALPDFQEFNQRVAEPCLPIHEEDCEVVA